MIIIKKPSEKISGRFLITKAEKELVTELNDLNTQIVTILHSLYVASVHCDINEKYSDLKTKLEDVINN